MASVNSTLSPWPAGAGSAMTGGASEATPYWKKGTNGRASPARRMARELRRAANVAREGWPASRKVNIIRPLNDLFTDRNGSNPCMEEKKYLDQSISQ